MGCLQEHVFSVWSVQTQGHIQDFGKVWGGGGGVNAKMRCVFAHKCNVLPLFMKLWGVLKGGGGGGVRSLTPKTPPPSTPPPESAPGRPAANRATPHTVFRSMSWADQQLS